MTGPAARPNLARMNANTFIFFALQAVALVAVAAVVGTIVLLGVHRASEDDDQATIR
jgi:hypothetical protein